MAEDLNKIDNTNVRVDQDSPVDIAKAARRMTIGEMINSLIEQKKREINKLVALHESLPNRLPQHADEMMFDLLCSEQLHMRRYK